MQKLAACALIMNDDGKVLAVHRRNDPNDFGFCGGKIDEGELPLDAMIRECMEETGYQCDFEFIDIRFDGSYEVYCYRGTNPIKVSDDDEKMWAWVDSNDVCKGSFAEFNTKLLTEWGIV